jgi:hypothetical protein
MVTKKKGFSPLSVFVPGPLTLSTIDARVLHLMESTGTGYVPVSVPGTYPYLNL